MGLFGQGSYNKDYNNFFYLEGGEGGVYWGVPPISENSHLWVREGLSLASPSIIRTLEAFFARQQPVSSIAKPASPCPTRV